MTSDVASGVWQQIPILLRGEPATIQGWFTRRLARRWWTSLAIIIVGTALFGAALGCWRAPLQAVYTALKLPLIVLLTTLGNALINGMLAPLLGLRLGLRQSLLAVVLSFTIAALILGAFSPLVLFLVWNTPPLGAGGRGALPAYDFLMLSQVAAIALAGVAAHIRLWQWLCEAAGRKAVAGRVLLAWLAVNLLLGGQLSWMLRPFVGSPGLAVQFLRADAFKGNFFEAIWHTLSRSLFP